jgi:hypothetical protein
LVLQVFQRTFQQPVLRLELLVQDLHCLARQQLSLSFQVQRLELLGELRQVAAPRPERVQQEFLPRVLAAVQVPALQREQVLQQVQALVLVLVLVQQVQVQVLMQELVGHQRGIFLQQPVLLEVLRELARELYRW